MDRPCHVLVLLAACLSGLDVPSQGAGLAQDSGQGSRAPVCKAAVRSGARSVPAPFAGQCPAVLLGLRFRWGTRCP